MMWIRKADVHNYKVNIPISNTLQEIFRAFQAKGWQAMVVGGSVRDAILGFAPKDIDIEVYGATIEDLQKFLTSYGKADIVGKSYGVVKLYDKQGNDYDFSVPRREKKTGAKHTDFEVTFDPSITPKEAASRRDFTINALAYDPVKNELHDYFGGIKDLENKTLRHTSGAFVEDPLRVLRGMQFASRFGLNLAPETAQMIKSDLTHPEHFSSLAKERIAEEFMKLATKGKFPGRSLQFLQDSGWIKFFPQLEAILNVPQNPKHHPEGGVFTHTAHVMDSAANIADRDGLTGDNRAVLIFSALGHDLAKATTTKLEMKNGEETWTSHGHEAASVPVIEELLTSIGIKKDIINRVKPLVAKHMEPIRLQDDSIKPKTVRQLAHDLHPATIEELAQMVEADHSGRPPKPPGLPQNMQNILDLAKTEGVHNTKPVPIIQGRDVLPLYGNQAGPHIGEATKDAYNAQLQARFSNSDEAQGWLRNHLRGRVAFIKGEDVLPYFNNQAGPQIGEIINEAWNAQIANAFTDKQSAIMWLENRMKQQQLELNT